MIDISAIQSTGLRDTSLELEPALKNVQINTTLQEPQASPFAKLMGNSLNTIGGEQFAMRSPDDISAPIQSSQDPAKAKMLALMGRGIGNLHNL